MTRPDCIIKEKTVKGKWVSSHDIRIARLEGKPEPKQQISVRYVRKDTKDEYVALSGGIGWPSVAPGFVVVMGVQKGKNGYSYRALEEFEDKNIDTLLDEAYHLWCKWGRNCGSVSWFWYGDVHRPGYGDFLYKANERIVEAGDKEGEILVSPPPHYDKPNQFEIQMRLLFSLTKFVGRLSITQCKRLTGYFEQMTDRDIKRGRAHNHPALYALGAVVSALYEHEPWLIDARQDVDIQSYEDYALQDQAITMRYLQGNDIFGIEAMETEEGSRGMVPTVYED